jgi:hypothetical protein
MQPCSKKVHIALREEFLSASSSDDHALAYFCLLSRGNPAAFRMLMSPSANHLLAFTNCTTLRICLPAMMGLLTPARTQGQKESILFARANSNAPAL